MNISVYEFRRCNIHDAIHIIEGNTRTAGDSQQGNLASKHYNNI